MAKPAVPQRCCRFAPVEIVRAVRDEDARAAIVLCGAIAEAVRRGEEPTPFGERSPHGERSPFGESGLGGRGEADRGGRAGGPGGRRGLRPGPEGAAALLGAGPGGRRRRGRPGGRPGRRRGDRAGPDPEPGSGRAAGLRPVPPPAGRIRPPPAGGATGTGASGAGRPFGSARPAGRWPSWRGRAPGAGRIPRGRPEPCRSQIRKPRSGPSGRGSR